MKRIENINRNGFGSRHGISAFVGQSGRLGVDMVTRQQPQPYSVLLLYPQQG